MPNEILAAGTKFKREDSPGAGTFTEIARITSIEDSKSKDAVEVSALDSTNKVREFISGFRDSGTVNLEMNFLFTTNYDILNGDYDSNSNFKYQIVANDSNETTIEFDAIVTDLTMSASSMDAVATASCTLKRTGPITISS